jgi:leucyl/phenylalanyl-tRNA--protein transferase
MAAGPRGDLRLYRSVHRALLPLDDRFRIPRSVRRALAGDKANAPLGGFHLALNHDFEAVLADCSGRPETWISDELRAVYRRLHGDGLAHSVEVRDRYGLAAGMIGLAIGACWIGETMAHRRPQAGHALLVGLVRALRSGGFQLFDVQLSNPHLQRFGCFDLHDDAFRPLLERARSRPACLRVHDGFLASEPWMAGWP